MLSDSVRTALFRLLAILALAVFAFGVLFAQTPARERTADLLIFMVATILSLLALAIGWIPSGHGRSWRPNLIVTFLLIGELGLAAVVIIDVLQHRRVP
jgi:uncharacterized membrane protein YoaK (UPF0700 family)